MRPFSEEVGYRIERIEAILRANQMHEESCSYFRAKQETMFAKCDCWLTKPDLEP